MRKISGTAVAYVGYLFFLVGFASLGMFVAALGLGSGWSIAIGAVAVGAFALAALEIRAAGRREGGLWGKPFDPAPYKAQFRGVVTRARRPRHWPVQSAGLQRTPPRLRRRIRHPARSVRGRYTAIHRVAPTRLHPSQ